MDAHTDRDALSREHCREGDPGLGTLLHEAAMTVGVVDVELVRDKTPHQPIDLR